MVVIAVVCQISIWTCALEKQNINDKLENAEIGFIVSKGIQKRAKIILM